MKFKVGDRVKVYTVRRPHKPIMFTMCVRLPSPEEFEGRISKIDPSNGLVMVDREWFHPKQCKKARKSK